MAKVKIPIAERIALNGMFKKLASMLGYADAFSFDFGEQLDANTSSDFSTLYVDGTNGSDSNLGTANKPFKTIGAALNAIPDKLRGVNTINIAPGTYNESLILSKDIVGRLSTLDIVGGWKTPTLTSGPTTCPTVTHDGYYRYSVAGAGWTAGELKGKFVKATANATAAAWGYYFPIHNNGTDWIDLCEISGNIEGFDIFEPSVEITNTSASSYLLESFNNAGKVLSSTGGEVVAEDYGLRFSNIKFTSNSSRGCFYAIESSIGFINCAVNTASKPMAFLDGSRVHFFRSSGYSTSNQFIYYQGRPSTLNLVKTSLYNVSLYARASGARAHFTAGNCLFESSLNSAYFLNMGPFGYYSVNSCKSLGYQYFAFDDAADQVGGGNRLSIYNTDITATVDGINLRGSHSNVLLIGTTNIHNCGGFGVRVAQAATAGLGCHQNVIVAATVSMSGNTSGDFTIDGTTAISLAELRADPDKVITNTVACNTLCAT